MAYMFGSDEWAQAFMEAVNNSEAYAKAAAKWEGDFYFVVVPQKYFDEKKIYYIDLWHGKCRAAYAVADEKEKKPAFVMSTSDSNWKAIIDKQLDPIKGMVTRKIKLQGNMAIIMRYVKAAQELVNCAAEVPTEFPPAH